MNPTLILLHGALGSETQFNELRNLLEKDFSLLSFTFPGHGGRNIPNDFTIRHFTTELHQFIENHEVKDANIFGYSMGGYVALSLASLRPGHVSRIMTLGTKLKWDPAIAAHEIKMLDPEIIETKVPKFAEELRQRHSPQDWKALIHKTAELMKLLGDGEAMTLEVLEKIDIPVMIGLGSLDQMVSREESVEVANALPHGEFHLFEGFRHPIELVDVNVLADAIRKYFIPSAIDSKPVSPASEVF